ncbi:hypothetical protein HanPI659440_Chr03g0135841 [Helianthus annuus]|nr:hypothetical protein HanPI659440_Chr03g0135841 [Helianthus annuus]
MLWKSKQIEQIRSEVTHLTNDKNQNLNSFSFFFQNDDLLS